MKPLGYISHWKTLSPFVNDTVAQFNLSPFPREIWPQKSLRLLESSGIRICIFQENALFQSIWKADSHLITSQQKAPSFHLFISLLFFLSPCHFLHDHVYPNFTLCPFLCGQFLEKEQITGKKELGEWPMYALSINKYLNRVLSLISKYGNTNRPVWKKWIFLNAWANQRFINRLG